MLKDTDILNGVLIRDLRELLERIEEGLTGTADAELLKKAFPILSSNLEDRGKNDLS